MQKRALLVSTKAYADIISHCMQKRLTVEYERWQQYLDTPTRKPLIGIVEEQLLRSHVPAILEKGFDALMAEKRYALTFSGIMHPCHCLMKS